MNRSRVPQTKGFADQTPVAPDVSVPALDSSPELRDTTNASPQEEHIFIRMKQHDLHKPLPPAASDFFSLR